MPENYTWIRYPELPEGDDWRPMEGRFKRKHDRRAYLTRGLDPYSRETEKSTVIVSSGSSGVPGLYAFGSVGIVASGLTDGVYGESLSDENAGVAGVNDRKGVGIVGKGDNGTGVLALSQSGVALKAVGKRAGEFQGNVFVSGNGEFQGNVAVRGNGDFQEHVSVSGNGEFQGNVAVGGNINVKGDVILEGGGDCSENFRIEPEALAEPGTVMVTVHGDSLAPCATEYSKDVVGVISGAGNLKPAIVLGRASTNECHRAPIALVGRVYCKVDARFAAIERGDLLTTSATPGHAMKAVDSSKAFGAVIGKALEPMSDGIGFIQIIVALG